LIFHQVKTDRALFVIPLFGNIKTQRQQHALLKHCRGGGPRGGGWRPRSSLEEEARQRRIWTLCEVDYRHRRLLNVSYRFQREVHDEPDLPGLDQRVRQLVQRMLDGAETSFGEGMR